MKNHSRIKQIPALSCHTEAADISNRVLRKLVVIPQSSLELEELAEEHRKKLAEIDLKGLELEDELSEISENAEESGLTRISPQLTIDEKERTRHWVESVDHNQPDAVVVPNQEQHVRSTAPEKLILHQQITWSHQILQERIMARQLLVIRDCISVTTFTDNDIILAPHKSRTSVKTTSHGQRHNFGKSLLLKNSFTINLTVSTEARKQAS